MKDEDWLYKKRNGKYVKIKPFEGFPADGIWLVTSKPGLKSHVHLTELVSADRFNIRKMAELTVYEQEACKYLTQKLDRSRTKGESFCVADVIKDIIKILSQAEEKPKPPDKFPHIILRPCSTGEIDQ